MRVSEALACFQTCPQSSGQLDPTGAREQPVGSSTQQEGEECKRRRDYAYMLYTDRNVGRARHPAPVPYA